MASIHQPQLVLALCIARQRDVEADGGYRQSDGRCKSLQDFEAAGGADSGDGFWGQVRVFSGPLRERQGKDGDGAQTRLDTPKPRWQAVATLGTGFGENSCFRER
jgi:hypothetical protein